MRSWDRFVCISWIASALIALSSGSTIAQPLDQQQLLLIDSTVTSICTSISTNGYALNANLTAGITARVATLFSKLIPVNANVNAAISGSNWSGVAQKDSAVVVIANMNCREKAFEKLVTLLREPGRDVPGETAPNVEARKAAKAGQINTALSKWLTAARQNDPQAEFEVAQIYDYGTPGVRRDCSAATHWYKEAAAHKLAAANYNVGGEYYYGCAGFFPPDHAEALRWLQRAVSEGSPEAEYEIGMIYYDGGMGVAQNKLEAKSHLTHAAQQGNKNAQIALKNFIPS